MIHGDESIIFRNNCIDDYLLSNLTMPYQCNHERCYDKRALIYPMNMSYSHISYMIDKQNIFLNV